MTSEPPPADPRSAPGRRRLLDAARRLFDEHGLHGVSARAIAQAAGHRNVAAVNYHFGDLDGLLLALVTEHADAIDAARHRRLDELEAAGPVTTRQAVEVIVGPLVDLLGDAQGRQYLRLLNQLASHPVHADEVNVAFAGGLVRAAAHMTPLTAQLPDDVRPHRVQDLIGLVLFSLARQARLIDHAAPPVPPLPTAAYTAELIRAVETQLRP
jgi:AcrR family transcriptional regulator